MIILSKEQIAQRLNTPLLAEAIADAYIAASAGHIELPPVGHITFPSVDADCHIKYGHRRGDATFVIKVATGFPQNGDPAVQPRDGDRPVPVNNGVSLVLSAETGEVLAALHDEMLMTDIRTAIGGAVATLALARSDASNLLVVGTGVQARRQIKAHRDLLNRPLTVSVWGRRAERVAALADEVPDIQIADDLDAACAQADIIVTTTAARDPIIKHAAVGQGTHITAVGADAPGKHELEPALLFGADVLVADNRAQCFDHGELSVVDPATQVAELGEVLACRAPGRHNPQQITVADLTGIAAQDIAIAQAVLAA